MALNTMAQSSTDLHIGPILSIVQLKAIAPKRLTRPQVGRGPVPPFSAAGEMIDPRVSVPMPNTTRPPAVAEPGPADEPLDPRSTFHGLFVRPRNQLSPCASAPIDSLATSTAPAAVNRSTIVAS